MRETGLSQRTSQCKEMAVMDDVTETFDYCFDHEQRETLHRLLNEAGCFSDPSLTIGRFEQCCADYWEEWQRLFNVLKELNLKPMSVGRDRQVQPFVGDQAQVTKEFFELAIMSSERGQKLVARFIADVLEVWSQATNKNMALVLSREGYFQDWTSAYRKSHALCLLLDAISTWIPPSEVNQLLQIAHDGGDCAAVEHAAFLFLESAETERRDRDG